MARIKKLVKCLLIIAIAVLCLIFSNETAESIRKSIDVCLTSIIPSMFTFMVISSFIIDSGLYRHIFKPFHCVLKRFIPLSTEMMSIFLLSLIGGYPTGAKLLKELIAENKNYSEVAAKVMTFSCCVSPSFAVIMLGSGIFGSTQAGFIIYLSNIATNLITAVFVSRSVPNTASNSRVKPKENILIRSINSASSSLLTVCSAILAFNVILTLVKCVMSCIKIEIPVLLLGSFEISNLLNGGVTPSMLPLVSAISSFGGICVLFQTAAIVKGSFSLRYFLLSRIPCAMFSAAVTRIIMCFWEISAEASTNGGYTYIFSTNKAIVPILIIMCIIIFKESEKNFKKV